MACKNCSELRCRLYGFVSGLKTQWKTGWYCGGEGAGCEVFGRNGNRIAFEDFGNTRDTLIPFAKLLYKAFIARLKGNKHAK